MKCRDNRCVSRDLHWLQTTTNTNINTFMKNMTFPVA